MRKVVLAELTSEDSQIMRSKEALYATLISLLENQFAAQEDKTEILRRITNEQKELYSLREKIFTKYNMPQLDQVKLNISYETNEVFVMIP